MPERIRITRNQPWRDEHPDAVRVDVGKYANPFRRRTPYGLARVPAVHTPDRDWEYESRISADGMQHDCGWPLDGWMVSVGAPTVAEIRAELAGRDLACWCPLTQPCHADVLLEIANGDDHA